MAMRPLEYMAAPGEPTAEMECPVCGEIRRCYLFVVRGLPVARCPNCGLVSLNPQPSLIDVRASYGDMLGGEDPRLLWTDDFTETEAARRYLTALRWRGLDEGRLLLVAPPGHPFAVEARAGGFEVGLHISIAEIETGTDLGSSFDAAVILYQLDKAMAPLAGLTRIHTALRPGGILLLVTPSLDSWPAHFFADQWTEWRPENRYYFGKHTIQSILLKSGFARIGIEPERRRYTLSHVHSRAVAFPRTALTRLIGLSYRLVPSPLRNIRLPLASSGMIVTAARAERRERPLFSIIVPVYNEQQTFATLMDRLLAKRVPGVDREIIVVESNSQDGTREAALSYQEHPEVKLVLQPAPRGKGNAVREGLEQAQGDVVMIQDADLEYDLNDYDALLEPLLAYRAAFVLGARHGGNWKMRQFTGQRGLSVVANIAHVFFTTLINLLYGQRLKDPLTMFKVFRRDCLYGLQFECNRFDFDHELVIKLVRKGYRPLEIAVNYTSRSFKEGKKIRMLRDPWTWLWADIKYRFVR